jgi:hypothetical protein
MNDVPTTEFTEDAPMRPQQTHGRSHFWTKLLRLRLVWPWRKANVSQLQVQELFFHPNSGNGQVTEIPLSTSGLSSSPSRERGERGDQIREDGGKMTTYSHTVARDKSRQHNGDTISNGNTTYTISKIKAHDGRDSRLKRKSLQRVSFGSRNYTIAGL